MVSYVVRRLLLAALTVLAISVLSFIIIHLPPGDYVTSYIASMSASGSAVSEGEANALREQLGLDQPGFRALLELGRASAGDHVVIVAGAPPGKAGSTNTVRVHRIGGA